MVSVKCLCVCIFLLAVTQDSSAKSNMNQGQVSDTARTFCQSVATPIGQMTEIEYVQANMLDETNWYYDNYWKISFGQIEVCIADANGVIIRYHNFSVSNNLDNQPGGIAIPESDAIQHATDILQATNHNEELVFDNATLMQHTNPPKASDHEWYIDWVRQYSHIPYKNDRVNLSIQAETGDIKGFAFAFNTPPPQSTAINISIAQADAIANAQVVDANLQNAILDQRKLEILLPNDFWQTGNQPQPSNSLSRVAYTYYFSVSETRYELYVDADTGNVIGGSMDEPLGETNSTSHPALKKLLKDAQEFRIYKRTPKVKTSRNRCIVLNVHSNPQMFNILKKARHCRNVGRLALAEYRVELISAAKKKYQLYLIPDTCRIGKGEQWGIIPDSFKAWLQKVQSSQAKKILIQKQLPLKSISFYRG